jgi:anti-sigma factor RsiW
LTPSAEVTAHLAACSRCATELTVARRIERLLATSPAAEAPASFVPSVLRRVRRERWRAEQYLDLGFNLVIAVCLALVAGGVWLLLHLTGLAAVTEGTAELLASASRDLIRGVEPMLPIYTAAAGLVAMAIGVWWWAERGTA